jgi:hypothetical protein
MICASCENIFSKDELIERKRSHETGKYKHSQYTRNIRDTALKGCQICSMICDHFDADSANRPLEHLNLSYSFEGELSGEKRASKIDPAEQMRILFSYNIPSREIAGIRALDHDKEMVILYLTEGEGPLRHAVCFHLPPNTDWMPHRYHPRPLERPKPINPKHFITRLLEVSLKLD